MISMETLKGVITGVLNDLEDDNKASTIGCKSDSEADYRRGQVNMLRWVLKEMEHE